MTDDEIAKYLPHIKQKVDEMTDEVARRRCRELDAKFAIPKDPPPLDPTDPNSCATWDTDEVWEHQLLKSRLGHSCKGEQ
ncbi:MAG TPA: hypothetical protein VNN17_07765 [Terriglobia bacterium]|nr:hypothetical protein [Terriglobia bacterium]